MTHSWIRRVGLLTVGALATTGPVLLAEETSVDAGNPDPQALAAAGWRDMVTGQRAPLLPDPSASESAIVILESAPLAQRAAADRRAAATEIGQQQRTLESSLAGLGATVNFRYQNVINGLAIRLPSGRLPLVAALPGVTAVHPVTYMAPATETEKLTGKPLPGATAPAPQPGSERPSAATVALIDAGLHSQHPWLGGGIGNTRLIVGGADFVQGGKTPEVPPQLAVAEAHGTEMASLILNSEVIRELPVPSLPRMFAYRVMAAEKVNGRSQMLARSDRVIAAMDRAVDPNQDHVLDDHPSVILLGVSRGWPTSGTDPVREAADNADRIGSVVIAPAGNDGPPGDASAGTVAGPAASESVLTVGAVGEATAPRTASLSLVVGPADARLTGLPLIGAAPAPGAKSVIILSGKDGISAGTEIGDYIDARGHSRVRGALVVVARGGGSIPAKARLAAQAGAAGLLVWDQTGDGRFPGVDADTVVPVPVLGLGRTQGQSLVAHTDLQAEIIADAATPTGMRVASFSSRGPTVEGRSEPDVVAPGVDIEVAYPGDGPELRTARVSGTSPAAAQVAAMVLRLRIDNPSLTPAQARSIIVQSAQPLPGERVSAQGAGVVSSPQARAAAIEPAIVSVRRPADAPAGTVPFAVSSLSDAPLSLRAAIVRNGGTVVAPGAPIDLPPRGRSTMNVTVPAGVPASDSTLVLIGPDGQVVASAPFVIVPPITSTVTLAPPRLATKGRHPEVTVSLTGGGTARSLEVWLLPTTGASREPIRMDADAVHGDWPSGTYRFALTRRDATGKQIAAGKYRVRIRALAPNGTSLARVSAPFALR